MASLLKTNCGQVGVVRPNASCEIVGSFVDGAGVAVTLSQIGTFTMTLYDKATNAIINARSAVNIKNANLGVVNSDGTFVVNLTPSDNVIVGDRTVGDRERHVLRLQWTWTKDFVEKTGVEELEFEVQVWAEPS